MGKGRYFAEWTLIVALMGIAKATPWEQLPMVAAPLARLLWWALPKRRAITVDNLTHALKCSPSDALQLAHKVFQHVALTALEFLKMGTAPQDALMRVRLQGLDEAQKAWKRWGRLILVTGHLGNFELLGAKLAQVFPLWVVARPQSPAAWKIIRHIRESVGMRVLDKFGSVREALRVLRRGEVLGLLADQHAGDGSAALVLPFFGRPATFFKTPALLAARTGAPLVFCYDVRLPDGTHKGVLLPPCLVSEAEVPAATEWFCRQLEQAILQTPEQWWWLHDRWKINRS
jgi:KDO2-lipid IV(A) lauroyltransferase